MFTIIESVKQKQKKKKMAQEVTVKVYAKKTNENSPPPIKHVAYAENFEVKLWIHTLKK